MGQRPLGLLIAGAGLVLMVVGLLAFTGALGWFGKLPGDIRIERNDARFYFPITSMIVVSIVLSLVLAFLRRFF